ncbi:MAG: CHASE3 domain-containing protein [Deltaproteobacteria bacterium]
MPDIDLPQHSPSRSTQFRSRILVLTLSVVLAAFGLALFQAIVAERASRDQVARTVEIMTLLSDSLRAGIDAETGQRGYLLTDDPSYLGPYEIGSREWLSNIDKLEATLSGIATPSQTANLAEMRALAVTKLGYLNQTVALAQSGDRAQAIEIMRSDAGKQAMDAFRLSVGSLQDEERAILQRALDKTRTIEARTIPIFGVLALWIIALVVLGFWFERRAAAAEAQARDVEAMKRAQERAELLARELNHRVKNLFAVIIAIVNLSSRGQTDVKKVVTALRSRIQALSLAHAVSQGELDSPIVDLHKVLAATLGPYEGDNGRVSLDGPTISVPVKAVTPLGLVIHELATNAVKYGGLSGEQGRVNVTWTREQGEDGPEVKVIWQEQGGPPADVSSSDGFGTVMMKTAASQLQGTLSREFTEIGMCAILTFPIS